MSIHRRGLREDKTLSANGVCVKCHYWMSSSRVIHLTVMVIFSEITGGLNG
jgi:hypothetical protein